MQVGEGQVCDTSGPRPAQNAACGGGRAGGRATEDQLSSCLKIALRGWQAQATGGSSEDRHKSSLPGTENFPW